jgi:hypothetical protein
MDDLRDRDRAGVRLPPQIELQRRPERGYPDAGIGEHLATEAVQRDAAASLLPVSSTAVRISWSARSASKRSRASAIRSSAIADLPRLPSTNKPPVTFRR